ncbi:MAG TPA: hypothetical protein VMM18_00130 [Gemmatimonadaceae bacterium]|nr:hypothetical protein [Gemmatimonadaceae bacterium]
MPGSRPLRSLLVFAITVACLSCITSRGVGVSPLAATAADSVTVRSPVKAHLLDASTVVFTGGATVIRDTVHGAGWRWDLLLAESTAVARIPLDSVLAMESFATEVSSGRTLVYSTLATAAALGGAVALICVADPKCFGSCPTIYADSAGTPVLEAEGFSGSISPLLEARDVDRLRTRADSLGIVRLEVWNEALETHFINHLELLAAEHGADEVVLPDQRGRPLAVAAELMLGSVTDRSGRDLRAVLARSDGDVFSSDTVTIAAATASDLLDHIDIALVRPAGADSVAVVLRLRSSLLNTLVFYDYMLARPGARSLDWMAEELTRLDRVAELGRWYGEHFGVRVSVHDGTGWLPVAKYSDYGPIAWRDVGLMVPVPTGDSVRIRLSFLTDQWRIDRLAVAGRVRRVTPTPFQAASVTASDGTLQDDALAALRAPDDHYLKTTPRQRFAVTFDVGRAPAGGTRRTFLLASQGYYIEWVRGTWMSGTRDTATFVPSAETLVRALRDWESQRDSMERQFFRSRIPVL